MLIAGGVYINNLYGILGIHAVPLWLGYPLTILIVVFIINAINLIDGIDGLASGLCSVACLFYGLTFFMLHQHVYAILAFATLGVLVPFFYYNVFGNAEHGRKIFGFPFELSTRSMTARTISPLWKKSRGIC